MSFETALKGLEKEITGLGIQPEDVRNQNSEALTKVLDQYSSGEMRELIAINFVAIAVSTMSAEQFKPMLAAADNFLKTLYDAFKEATANQEEAPVAE